MERTTGRCCLSIGVFDGVHLGHRAVLTKLRRESERTGLVSAVVTFRPHPDEVVRGQQVQYLCSWEERCRLLIQEGVQWLEVVHFTKRVASMTAQKFMMHELCSRLTPASLIVGHDFRMGRGRSGGHGKLRQLGESQGFEVIVIEPVVAGSEVVSSTAVRQALDSGEVERAARLLGRDFVAEGVVVRGAGRGTGLQFPTANLDVDKSTMLPADGVYAVRSEVGGRVQNGVANIGVRPTFGDGPRSVEVYLLNFDRNLLGERVRVSFAHRLRDEQRFNSADALVAQIEKDVQAAACILDGDDAGRQ